MDMAAAQTLLMGEQPEMVFDESIAWGIGYRIRIRHRGRHRHRQQPGTVFLRATRHAAAQSAQVIQ